MSLLLWRKLHHGSSAVAADAYAVGGNAPEFVADFAGTLNSGTEYYRSGGTDTTFSSVFAHSGLVLPATMTDSDGVLKWAPHNLCDYSEDFSNAAWLKTGTSATGGQSDPDGGSNAYLITATATNALIENINIPTFDVKRATIAVFAKAGTASWFFLFAGIGNTAAWFDLSNGVIGTEQIAVLDARITSVGGGWYLCEIDVADYVTTGDFRIEIASGDNSSSCSVSDSIYVFGAHVYRSDLGGMVNNPDRGDSYVPTTTAARFLPRRNHHIYNGASWENAGILIEPAAATNLLTFSNDFDNAAYSRFQMSVTEGQTNEITGQSDAVLLTGTGSSGTVSWSESLSVATSTAHTFSIYAKAGTANWLRLGGQGLTTPSDGGVYFNLSNGTIGTQDTGWAGKIENVASGWYRCSVTFTTDASDSFGVLLINVAEADNDISWASISSPTMYVYGLQFEVGSVPTSYIPTAGSTVTRAAETLTVAGANLPANTTGVSVQMQGRMTYADLGAEAQRTFWRWYNGASDFLLCDLDTDGADTGEVNANQSDTTGGAGTVAIDAYSPGINVAYNIASRHSNTDINLAVDGTAGTADATPTALHDASSDTFQVAHNLQGTVGMLRVWGVGLSDTDLESAT